MRRRLRKNWDLVLPTITLLGGFIGFWLCFFWWCARPPACDLEGLACLLFPIVGAFLCALFSILAVVRSWRQGLGFRRLVLIALPVILILCVANVAI